MVNSCCSSDSGRCCLDYLRRFANCLNRIGERRWVRGLAYLLFYFLAFMPSLAMLFMAIEGPVESGEKNALRLARQAFLSNHTCLSDADLERFLAAVLAANNRGVSALRNASAGRSNWSFGQALFFATTVVTTIGYGRTTPLSYLGKAMCILVALIGIPLTLVAFSLTAGWLRRASLRCLAWLRDRLPTDRQSQATLIHLGAIFAALLICFLLIPAGAFASLERDWTYLDAFYYCVISLTTVGLGDFIVGEHPDQENRLVYKIFAVIYLYAGLIFLVFALRSFADVPNLNPGRFIYSEDADNGSDASDATVETSDEAAKLLPSSSGVSESGNLSKLTVVGRRGYDSTAPVEGAVGGGVSPN